jgi:signal transduction histidine kinase
MDTKDTERLKPFKLVKYFTFTSLIVILLGALILSLVIARRAETLLIRKSEDYALLMAENLNHQVFVQFIIPAALQFGQVIQLRNDVLFERLDQVVRNTLHSFNVEMVNIFAKEKNVIFYSFDKELLGKEDLGGTDYLKALEGESSSRLIGRSGFWRIFIGPPKESILLTYVPLRAEKPLSNIEGPILGVFEIVQDLSDDYETIAHYTYKVIATSVVVMGLLFIALRHIVKRGETIIERRAEERLLLKQKLNQAERLAGLGEMVAAVSHEIRTPLGIISSTAELLKRKLEPSDPQERLAQVIVQEANRLNSIVTDFLNFARPTTPNLMPCNVAKVLERNLDFLAPQMNNNGYKIHKNFDGGHEIQADPGMLYQAFLNILMNAMQAMPEGGSITIELFDTADDTLRVIFSDEGKGIAGEDAEKLWEPFFTTKEKGSGLGLAIVKKIVEGHGGAVHIGNRPEKGAQVTVDLPKGRAVA